MNTVYGFLKAFLFIVLMILCISVASHLICDGLH